MATVSERGTLKIWDTDSWQEVLNLPTRRRAHRGRVRPRRRALSTVSESGELRVYALDLAQLLSIAAERVSRPLTDEECLQYLHAPCGPADPADRQPVPDGGGQPTALDGAYQVTLTESDWRDAGPLERGRVLLQGSYTLMLLDGTYRLTQDGPDVTGDQVGDLRGVRRSLRPDRGERRSCAPASATTRRGTWRARRSRCGDLGVADTEGCRATRVGGRGVHVRAVDAARRTRRVARRRCPGLAPAETPGLEPGRDLSTPDASTAVLLAAAVTPLAAGDPRDAEANVSNPVDLEASADRIQYEATMAAAAAEHPRSTRSSSSTSRRPRPRTCMTWSGASRPYAPAAHRLPWRSSEERRRVRRSSSTGSPRWRRSRGHRRDRPRLRDGDGTWRGRGRRRASAPEPQLRMHHSPVAPVERQTRSLRPVPPSARAARSSRASPSGVPMRSCRSSPDRHP